MSNLILPTRCENLEKVDNFIEKWDTIKLAIRPDYYDNGAIDKTKTAIVAGLNDAAINYIWNLTIFDLQRKIYIYGIDYFASAINWEGAPLKTQDDLREVKDHLIISGAFALGIIAKESHFFLQQCREIRNNFSTAHFPIGEIDKFETFNFIKNCIKYVLTFDLPVPGLQIKELVETLTEESRDDVDEIKIIIESQSSQMYAPILHNLFSNFIKQDCPPNLKHNIKLLAPYLWNIVSDETKSSIAAKFASLRDMKKDAAGEALAFLKIVNGVQFIPESFKEIIFKKHSQLLIDAHNGWNNFYNEPSYAKDLASLGKDVPTSAMYTYVKAVILSFIGNVSGVAVQAQEHNEQMIKEFSQTSVRVLFRILMTDIDVARELMNYSPIQRLNLLMELIKDKTMLPEQQELFDFIKNSNRSKIMEYFKKIYWKEN